MTRMDARAYFDKKGLTYSDISCTDLGLLVTLLDKHFSRERRERIEARRPVCWQRVNGIRGEYEPNGGVVYAIIAAKGESFTTTNAISFNRNGFIGFCGGVHLDDVQPVLAAFTEWCDELADIKAVSFTNGGS